MRTRFSARMGCAAAGLLFLTVPAPAKPIDYAFTTIADTSGPFFSVSPLPSINNAGTVAFQAILVDRVNTGIFVGSGGPTTTIANTADDPFGFLSVAPSINNAGTVGFLALGFGIFVSSGGPFTPIADNAGPFSFFSEPSINNAGTVAFVADLDGARRWRASEAAGTSQP